MTPVRCRDCGAELLTSRDPAPCPQCGGLQRELVAIRNETAEVRESGDWLAQRREVLANFRWLSPVMLAVNITALVIGLALAQVSALVLGIAVIVANQLLSPLAVRKIFFKEVRGSLTPTGHVTFKVNRRSRAEDEVAPEADAAAGGPDPSQSHREVGWRARKDHP